MKDINQNKYYWNKDELGRYIISNTLITDSDVSCLLSLDVPTNAKIMIYSSYLDILHIKNKEFSNLIKKCEIKGCEICVNKSLKIEDDSLELLSSENVIYNNGFIDMYLKTHNDKLDDIKSEFVKKINIKGANLSTVDLSFDYNFFQEVIDKKIEKVILPPIDFNYFNIEGVEFIDCKFAEGTKFNFDFFQKIKNKKILGCTLPQIDFNDVNIEDTIFMFTKFSNKTIFPKDPEFFKKFNNIYACSLPGYDYKEYKLNEVNMDYCSFRENSIFPVTFNLNSTNINNTYPKSFIKILHIIPIRNLNYEDIIFKYGKYLTEQQKVLIYFKLKK